MPDRLGQLLINAKLISQEQLNKALEIQEKQGGRLGTILVKAGILHGAQLLHFLNQQYGIPAVDLSRLAIDPAIIKLVPDEVAQSYGVIPIKCSGSNLSLAMVDPRDVNAINDIEFTTGYNVIPLVGSEGDVEAALSRYYGSSDQDLKMVMKDITADDPDMAAVDEVKEKVSDVKEAEDAPVVKLANIILHEAVKKKVSDVHLEPYETSFRIRYRLDGSLYEVMLPPKKLQAALTSRFKIMASLNIAERRLPQDGRIKLRVGDNQVDLRVSTLPCLFGEKIVIRILDKSNLPIDMATLGFEPKALEHFKNAITCPYGMVLVTGPTGSGKTTTLYSALNYINTPDVNIMTAEDPVEYNLMGINQVQMKEQIGLNFAVTLRSFLRQDPNIIMVGEIRDYETAEVAVKASLTGHLVLSTLHTNDASSTVARLLNMGIESFLVASSVILIISQRLVRRICRECKEVEKVDPTVLENIGFSKEEATSLVCYEGKGCSTCSDTGYKGRVALYEVMVISEEIRGLILKGASSDEIKMKAISQKMKSLRMSGLSKISEGITTVEEVVETTFKD